MDIKKHIRKISNINKKMTQFNQIRRINSPILFNKRIRNYLLVNNSNDNIKKNIHLKMVKSKKIIENKPCTSKKELEVKKYDEIKSFYPKKLLQKSTNSSNENSKIINYIQNKKNFKSISSKIPKKNSLDNIFNNILEKDKTIIYYDTKPNSSQNSLSKTIYNKTNKKKYNLKKNYINKIHLNIKNKKISTSSKIKEKKNLYSSNISISLDNLLSKTIIKNPKKNKKESLEKNNNFSEKKRLLKNITSLVNKKNCKIISNHINNFPGKKLDIQSKKNLLNRNKNLYRYNRKKGAKFKSENMTDIMRHLTKTNLLSNNKLRQKIEKIDNNPINDINKNKDIKIEKNKKNKLLYTLNDEKSHCKKFKKFFNLSRENSDLIFDDCFNALNNAKILNENYSTNDKSLNTKKSDSNNANTCIPQNIIINNNNNIYNNNKNNNDNSEKKRFDGNTNNNIKLENDEFVSYEFEIENEQNNKINGIRINNFDVKKPKEENLKFTVLKEDMESEVSISASKIIIGNIDGYKDIIETDKKNNQNKDKKLISSLLNKKSSKYNNCNLLDRFNENSIKNVNKKINNLSILLKKESETFTFNDDNFSNSINISNNFDGISSTISNNKIDDNIKNKRIKNYNSDNFPKSGGKLYKGKNVNLNTNSFSINNNKNINNFPKNVNSINIKEDNFENLFNRDNNIKNKKQKYNYNNNINFVDYNCKKNKLEKINDLCIIY